MAIGSLELSSRPLVLTLDSWPARGSDFNQFKPVDFNRQQRDRAAAAVNEAIGRIAAEGDALGRIQAKGRPIAELAAQARDRRRVTTDDLSLRFLTPPAITWSGGGLSAAYQPSIDFLL